MSTKSAKHYGSSDILFVQLCKYHPVGTVWDDSVVRDYLARSCPVIINDDLGPREMKSYRTRAQDLREAAPNPVLAVLVVRDYFNNYASLAKHKHTKRHCKDFATYWKRFAREVLGETDEFQPDAKIVYHRWFSDKHYRQSLCSALGLTFTDRALQYVNTAGGGSSFDGRRRDGNAQAMLVLDRAKPNKDCGDADLLSLNNRLLNESLD